MISRLLRFLGLFTMLSVEICPRSPTEIFRLSFAISFAAAFAVTPRPGRMPENRDATMTMVSTIEITRLGRWFTLLHEMFSPFRFYSPFRVPSKMLNV